MNVRTLRSFSTELLKIAGEALDADVRKLHADRKGKEYLVGGELPSNPGTPWAEKLANMLMAAGMTNFKADKKDPGVYQHVRDWGWRGAQGAAAGAGMTQLAKNMRGAGMTAKNYRQGAGIGAGIAIGDRVWRHHQDKKHKAEKTAMVNANPNDAFRSPAVALHEGQQTGGFKSHMTHSTGTAPKPFQIGKKFRLPVGAL